MDDGSNNAKNTAKLRVKHIEVENLANDYHSEELYD